MLRRLVKRLLDYAEQYPFGVILLMVIASWLMVVIAAWLAVLFLEFIAIVR